jgi:DNA-binding SARP family transcriptional activator
LGEAKAMGLEIRLLGKPAIIDGDGQAQAVRGLQAWALLARILLSRQALDRRDIALELFPDAIDPLGSLRWCLASLRRALKSAEALSGDPIQANLPAGANVDVLRLEAGKFDAEAAGDLLEGVEPRCSAAFSTWLLIERERTASLVNAKIRQEIMQAVALGDYARAIRFAEYGVRRAPLDEGAHILLVKSLALAGRTEAASEHVAATEKAFLAELGEKPSEALRSAARQTIFSPPSGVSAQAVVKSLIESGLAAFSAGAADSGLDCLRRAVAEAEKSRDRQLHAKALLELGSALVHSVRGYDDEGAILLGQAIELAVQCGSAQIAATAQREIGYVDALAGRRPVAAELLDKALSFSDDADSQAGIHAVIGFNLVDWGRVDEGLAHFEQSLDYARRTQNRRREAWSLGIGGAGQLAAGRLEKAYRWLTDCHAIVEDLRWIAFRPWPLAALCETKLRLGNDPTALRPELEDAFALSCQLRDPCWEGAVARVMALTYAATDDYARALQWLTEARKRCVRETDIYAALLVGIIADQAKISVRSGEVASAGAIARELLSLAAKAHMDGHVRWAVALIGGATPRAGK